VKLILPIASTIGRASKLVMSICSTGDDSNLALRVSLAWLSSLVLMSVSVVIWNSKKEIYYSLTTFERLTGSTAP